MKELISIINSKLQAVTDELKNQKAMLENKVKDVETDIERKVESANLCKSNVETSSNTISELEADIEKLKSDLQELHDKFDSAGFTELLEAGNKEINGKIIDNNTKIAEQQELIRRYSEEAQNLKDELTALKDSKINLETELNNTMVALKYYSKKIDDMTITAIEHADKLADITILDEDNNEMTNVDVNKVIDGTIFDEIDHISSGDKQLSEQELENILNSKEEVKEEKEEDLSKTQALDAAILETQELINNEPPKVETQEVVQTNEPVFPQVETQPSEPIMPQQPVENLNSPIQSVSNDSFINVPMNFEQQPTIDTDEFEKTLNLNIPTEEEQPQVIETVLEEPVNNVQDIKSTFADINESTVDINAMIQELDLDPSKFNEEDLKVLKGKLDVQKASKIIDVLDDHFISNTNIYTNPEILITMAPAALDEILDTLERAGCIATTIGYVFKYLDKINVDKLKESVKGPTDSIIKILYDCISERESTNISEVLELTPEDISKLESNLDAKEYNIFCTFPEVIKANYDTIRNLHVAEPARCITEHPKRFMNNPDIFDDILDKYDTPDLVRCINKNPAVIDKL